MKRSRTESSPDSTHIERLSAAIHDLCDRQSLLALKEDLEERLKQLGAKEEEEEDIFIFHWDKSDRLYDFFTVKLTPQYLTTEKGRQLGKLWAKYIGTFIMENYNICADFDIIKPSAIGDFLATAYPTKSTTITDGFHNTFPIADLDLIPLSTDANKIAKARDIYDILDATFIQDINITMDAFFSKGRFPHLDKVAMNQDSFLKEDEV